MRLKATRALLGVLPVFAVWTLLQALGSAWQATTARLIEGNVACAVTAPNGIAAGEGHEAGSFGHARLSVVPFGLWPNGTVIFKPGGAGFVEPDGALTMKFGWRRAVSGRLTIEGRRIDATAAPPLRSEVPDGYGERGFQPTCLIFPTPDCWEVTGRVGEAKVTFVTRVTRIGDGPSWRRSANTPR
jgi:hypothetical protein